jgi:DNA-binding protein HU-beta
MKKVELVEAMAQKTGLTKADSARALDAMLDALTKSLKKGEKTTLVGFGTFGVSKRKARVGRNPQTGAEVKIAARVVPGFKAGNKLKDALN